MGQTDPKLHSEFKISYRPTHICPIGAFELESTDGHLTNCIQY